MNNHPSDIYLHLLKKVLLAFAALMAAQLAFHLCNLRIFRLDGPREWAGLILGNIRFGLATVATLLLPYLLLLLSPLPARNRRCYRTLANVLYIVAVLVIIIPRGCNSAYYQYTYRLLSDEIFSYLGISGPMGSLVPHFAVDYWFAWACPLAITILFLLINRRIHPYVAPAKPRADWRLVLSALLLLLLVRGGIGRPLQPSDAARYVQPKNTALVSNDSYNILLTLFSPDLEEKVYMPSSQALSLSPTTHLPLSPHSSPLTPTPNIVLIIVESLGQEFMGCYNPRPDADTRTPFLDSLAAHSLLFDGRANGKKSIEGIMAITAAIPNLMSRPFANSSFARRDDYSGLPAVLRRNGYHTAFYHGSFNGVMGFDATCRQLGFDHYLGMDQYNAWAPANNDYDGVWGIFDEPFLQFVCSHISHHYPHSPFFAEVFTVTSHHPFPLPPLYKDSFPEGRHPILKCVEYTDHALRSFFQSASRQPWYSNTLFIITADHSGHGLSPQYNDYDGWYRIPLIFFSPNPSLLQPLQPSPQLRGRTPSTLPSCLRIVQQTDLYPTIVDLLGLPDTISAFGTSLLRSPLGRYVYYANGYHCLVTNNPVDPARHDITLIMGDYQSGTPQNLRLLRAIIQQYNHNILTNNLTPQ